ncbi:ATP-binding cassette domain-containing protein [Paenibacillus sp. 1P07SE]|uniref:ABC transporter ATP-binding protein n=1 Tax=Paenibacillus sp. 1P07SE TaxID=3132209 RepID=UPI0039A644AC
MSLLQVTNLRKSYRDQEVVRGIDFTVQPGECAALLGPNGAGKTTTIKMLTGITRPSSGEIRFLGKRDEAMREKIGYLPQHPTFYPWMTGEELLRFMGGLSGIEKNVLERRIRELLATVGLEQAARKRIGTYSGGMKQRLGIAQAIIHEPKLLIMDEPVSALDPLGRRDMLELLKSIRQRTTILFSTHILHDAQELCDRICILHRGSLVSNGSITDLLAMHQQPVFEIQAPDSNRWVAELAHQELVTSIEQHGPLVQVHVADIDRGRRWLLQRMHELGLPVQRFELQQESLEDIFMRLVNET